MMEAQARSGKSWSLKQVRRRISERDWKRVLEESFGGDQSCLEDLEDHHWVLQVRRKVEVCRQVLEVLDLIDPGGCDSDCDRWL